MSAVWVDADFGFDDLWALLVLRYFEVEIAGVSLVSGNTPLPQVCCNASAAKQVFACDWLLYRGAEKPLRRAAETAEHVLGPTGMQSRGVQLPSHRDDIESLSAIDALSHWIEQPAPHTLLALGPLTNIALLCERYADIAGRIDKLTWLGGSSGRGNQTPFAEFNAVADAEALAQVVESGIRLNIIDLELCRRVNFDESQMPLFGGSTLVSRAQLLLDLLGGYLDIALTRGRSSMAIYDPIAALAIARPEMLTFRDTHFTVHTACDEHYGRTEFNSQQAPNVRLATEIDADACRRFCMDALIAAASTGKREQGKTNV